MKFEIETPTDCSYCVFCEELCWCRLADVKHIDGDCENRPSWCPFDNSDQELYDGVKIIKG